MGIDCISHGDMEEQESVDEVSSSSSSDVSVGSSLSGRGGTSSVRGSGPVMGADCISDSMGVFTSGDDIGGCSRWGPGLLAERGGSLPFLKGLQ